MGFIGVQEEALASGAIDSRSQANPSRRLKNNLPVGSSCAWLQKAIAFLRIKGDYVSGYAIRLVSLYRR
jgi:hypothetical protein